MKCRRLFLHGLAHPRRQPTRSGHTHNHLIILSEIALDLMQSILLLLIICSMLIPMQTATPTTLDSGTASSLATRMAAPPHAILAVHA